MYHKDTYNSLFSHLCLLILNIPFLTGLPIILMCIMCYICLVRGNSLFKANRLNHAEISGLMLFSLTYNSEYVNDGAGYTKVLQRANHFVLTTTSCFFFLSFFSKNTCMLSLHMFGAAEEPS